MKGSAVAGWMEVKGVKRQREREKEEGKGGARGIERGGQRSGGRVRSEDTATLLSSQVPFQRRRSYSTCTTPEKTLIAAPRPRWLSFTILPLKGVLLRLVNARPRLHVSAPAGAQAIARACADPGSHKSSRRSYSGRAFTHRRRVPRRRSSPAAHYARSPSHEPPRRSPRSQLPARGDMIRALSTERNSKIMQVAFLLRPAASSGLTRVA